MTSVSFVGLLANLLFLVIVLLVLYLIIQAAVRNAIDQSETGKMIRAHLKEKTNTGDTKAFTDDDPD